jgi:putative ABC transport system ATP-binding protein
MDEVSMTYGHGMTAIRALRRVSLEVRRGEVLLLMGPSGSGKTTLLQILGGLLHPTEGSIRFEDQRLGDLDVEALCAFRLRHFGFVFQSYNLFPTLTAWENTAIICELQGVKAREAEARSRELLAYVGLRDHVDAFPEKMSGGQKQRVAIARAIVGEPDVVLADEPTAALDAGSGMRIGELLRDLAHGAGRAVVIVTHDPRLLKIADRIVVLEDGRILSSEEAPRGGRPTPLHVGSLL